MSMGTDNFDVREMRGAPAPGTARLLSAGRGITAPEPGRTNVPGRELPPITAIERGENTRSIERASARCSRAGCPSPPAPA